MIFASFKHRSNVVFSELLFRLYLIGYNILFLFLQLFLSFSMIIFHNIFHCFENVIKWDLKRKGGKKNG